VGYVRVEGDEICHGECDLGDSDVLMAVVVAKTGHELIETETAREGAELVIQGVVANRGDESGDGSDLVSSRGEGSHDEAEAVL
jgi:hypothetical protein